MASYTKGELQITEHDGKVKIYDESDRVLAVMVDGGYEEIRANAKLFIAAPDLYEACKIVLDRIDGYNYPVLFEYPFIRIKEAVALADGKDPYEYANQCGSL